MINSADRSEPSVIMIFAPSGLGRIESGAPLDEMIMELVAGHAEGPLQDGDIVVVTSKIISKAEGRTADRQRRDDLVRVESVRTLARRGATKIVRTRHGLTLAAAGIDNSNIEPELIVLLPLDPDLSAAALREALQARTGLRLGVIISDTAGRTWREGQVDQAIGAAGIDVARDYAGHTDGYGNDLLITRTAYADELASAADLVKTKLAGRPMAVVRGLEHLVRDTGQRARDLVRPAGSDLFGYGSREAVLAAALAVTGQPERYEELVDLEAAEQISRLLAGSGLSGEAAELLRALLSVDLSHEPPLSTSG